MCTWYLPSNLFHDHDPEADYTQRLLLGYTLKEEPEKGAKACPALLVHRACPPFQMFHGTNDRRVAYTQSVEMYEALEKNGVHAELFLIEGAPHGGLEFLQEPVFQRMGAFFDTYLKAGG